MHKCCEARFGISFSQKFWLFIIFSWVFISKTKMDWNKGKSIFFTYSNSLGNLGWKSNPMKTQCEVKLHFNVSDHEIVDVTLHYQLIGSLIYAMTGTCVGLS